MAAAVAAAVVLLARLLLLVLAARVLSPVAVGVGEQPPLMVAPPARAVTARLAS